MQHEELWVRHEQGDSQARAELIEIYYPLSKRVTARMHRGVPQHVELDEVASWGVLGLIRAVENFRREVGVQFETYAVASIRSAVLDEQRRLDWAPRSLRRKQREINKAREEAEAALGRAPSFEEIGARLEISGDDVRKTLVATETSHAKSLDEALSEEFGESHRQIKSQLSEWSHEAWMTGLIGEAVRELIETFSAQEQLILTLYYYYDLTLAEAGRIAGIPESRASQIHSRAVTRVRNELAGLLRPHG